VLQASIEELRDAQRAVLTLADTEPDTASEPVSAWLPPAWLRAAPTMTANPDTATVWLPPESSEEWHGGRRAVTDGASDPVLLPPAW